MARLGGRATPDMGLDLGTTHTRLVGRGGEVLAALPSVVAIQSGPEGRKAIAVGDEAWQMLGRATGDTRVVRPIRGGAIDDYEASEHLLKHVLGVGPKRSLRGPVVLIAVPLDASEAERRALQTSARAAGCREVLLVSSVVAAAIGAQLPVTSPVGSMVVDVGGGHTEIAVISLGGLVVRRALRLAGEAFDAAIVAWLRRHGNVMIGDPTAERIKIEIGAAVPPSREVATRVRARDLSTGAPRAFDVSGADAAAAVSEVVERLRDAVVEALRATPPELAADILSTGVVLTGGGARLNDLDRVLRDATGLPFLLSDQPELATARGLGALLRDPELLDQVTAST